VGLRAAPRAARPVDDSQRAALLSELRARGGRRARTRCGAARRKLKPAAAAQARAARRGIRAVARGRRAPLRGDARDPGAAPESGGRAGPRQVSSSFARFETRNAREILGIEECKDWKEAIEDAVKDMLRVESSMTDLEV
jgi:hypothetical protein